MTQALIQVRGLKAVAVKINDNAGRNNAGRDQNFSNKMETALDDIADDSADGDATLREGETAVLSILA